MVNAVVLVEEIQEEHQLTDKQGNAKKFKKVVVGDDTGSIVATFWGEDTEKISFRPGDVVMMGSMLVKDY
jgi:ssDNA-binding replication factor A large subunit